jgi:hypothetical protein
MQQLQIPTAQIDAATALRQKVAEDLFPLEIKAATAAATAPSTQKIYREDFFNADADANADVDCVPF